MPKRFRLTRRFPVAMTEDGYRKLKGFPLTQGWTRARRYRFCLKTFPALSTRKIWDIALGFLIQKWINENADAGPGKWRETG